VDHKKVPGAINCSHDENNGQVEHFCCYLNSQNFYKILSRLELKNMFPRVTSYNKVFFLILDCETIGTAATPGLLCEPRVIVKTIVEKQMECRLAGETEVL
jgi:hypothetical protein